MIFTTKEGEWEPQTGQGLGELTDELPPGVHIVSFAATAPKSYAYITSDGKSCVKVKGFRLNYKNSQIINFDSIKELIFKFTNNEPARPLQTVDPHKLRRDRISNTIRTVTEAKTFKVSFTKRHVVQNFDTHP